MPALYAHFRFGEEVVKHLPPPYVEITEKYPEAFALGTQGPDVLCYYKPTQKNETNQRAPWLHDWIGEKFFLKHAKKLLQNAPDGKVEDLLNNNGAFAAYTIGVLCHFTLDATCHLYIDTTASDKLTHGKMESEFDKCILRMDGKPIRGYNTATPILDTNGTREAAAKTMDVDEETISYCIKMMRKINKIFSFKCELVHTVLHFLLKLLKMERQFGDMFLHKKDDPLCEETNRYLVENFHTAIPKGAALIPQYFENMRAWVENGRTENELFRYDFSGIITSEE